MLGIDTRAARAAWTALAVIGALYGVYLIRATLLVFIAALLFAYLISPLVNLLGRALPLERSRGPALAIVYLGLMAALVAAVLVVGAKVAEQATALAAKAPQYIARIQPEGEGPAAAVVREIRQQVEAHSAQILGFVSKAGLSLLEAAGNLILVVLIPVLSFFFLKDGEAIRGYLLSAAGVGRERAVAEGVLGDLHHLLGRYMRALVILSGATFVAYAAALSLFGVPYALLLAALAAPLEFIPIAGPLIGAALVVAVDGFSGFAHLAPVLVFLAVYRLFQDYVLSPRLLSEGMELHPLAVMFGAFAGAEIGGVAGAFLSVPAMAALRIVYRRVMAR